MITNLVGNAIKFTEEGQVEVRVEEKSEGRLLISVADSGIGIPEDRVQAIFEEYSQATTTTTKEYGGTGLGLSISRRLVEMMGVSFLSKVRLGKGRPSWLSYRRYPCLRWNLVICLVGAASLDRIEDRKIRTPCSMNSSSL